MKRRDFVKALGLLCAAPATVAGVYAVAGPKEPSFSIDPGVGYIQEVPLKELLEEDYGNTVGSSKDLRVLHYNVDVSPSGVSVWTKVEEYPRSRFLGFKTNEFGLKKEVYSTPFGRIELLKHPMFTFDKYKRLDGIVVQHNHYH